MCKNIKEYYDLTDCDTVVRIDATISYSIYLIWFILFIFPLEEN